jgi:dienelactone hydrolase
MRTLVPMAPLVVLALMSGCASLRTEHMSTGAREVHAVQGATHVAFPSHDGDLTHGAATTIDAWLMRPVGDGPFPAVVLLHGCAGPYDKAGALKARDRDWAERLVAQGYVVVLPDSFHARGVDETCTREHAPVRPGVERARDAYGALLWLQAQSFVRGDDVGVLGWSNGGSAVLAVVTRSSRARPVPLAHDFRVAIALYPGCKSARERHDWLPLALPLHVLIGSDDDWTPAAPCEALVDDARAQHADLDLVVYPGAFHDFDDPHLPRTVRHNVASTSSHTATIATDPGARADAIERVTRILLESLQHADS